jgi:hypothetical protein
MKPMKVALLLSIGLLLGSMVTEYFTPTRLPILLASHTSEQDREAMDWIIQYMLPGNKVKYAVPTTRRLSKRDIGYIYAGVTGEYVDKDVQKRIAGLFDHESQVVYVPDDMGEKQAMISLVHEYVHYIQHYRDGSIGDTLEALRTTVQELREDEAYEIDDIYERKFLN